MYPNSRSLQAALSKSSLRDFSQSQVPVSATYHSCQSLLILVFTVNSALCSFLLVLVSLREITVGKILVSRTRSNPFALHFYREMITNRNMTWKTGSSLPASPNKYLNTVYTSVHCSQRTVFSLGRNCPMQSKTSHPHPEVSHATKANLGVSLCVKAWSGLWILEQTNTLVEPQQQIRYDGLDMAFFCISSLNL